MIELTMNKVNMAKLTNEYIFYDKPILQKLILVKINMNEKLWLKSK